MSNPENLVLQTRVGPLCTLILRQYSLGCCTTSSARRYKTRDRSEYVGPRVRWLVSAKAWGFRSLAVFDVIADLVLLGSVVQAVDITAREYHCPAMRMALHDIDRSVVSLQVTPTGLVEMYRDQPFEPLITRQTQTRCV